MHTRGIVLASLIMSAACGGGGGGGEPLLSGSLTGDYAGSAFTPSSGFATLYEDTLIIGVGNGDLHCGSPAQNDPPPGINAILVMPSFDVGSYSNVFVNMYYNIGEFTGAGSNSGTVEITASSAASVAGSVSYAYTDDEGLTYALDGTFEVVRCPE